VTVELVGQIGGPVNAVVVQGNTSYVGVGPRLVILDVSDLANPALVGRSPMFPDIVEGVAVAGSYAYVADGERGLRIVDVSNPAAPAEVGFYDTPGIAYDVAVVGAYAYVADGQAGLRIVGISDPTHPTEIGFYDTPGKAMGVAVAGDYAYVADEYEGLRILNVSDPAHPDEASFYDTMGYASGVAVVRNIAYVADEDGGLVILRIRRRIVAPLAAAPPTLDGDLSEGSFANSPPYPSSPAMCVQTARNSSPLRPAPRTTMSPMRAFCPLR